MIPFLPKDRRFSKDELEQILASSPVGLIVSRFDGTFEYANPALTHMLGYSNEEIYQPDTIISHPDDIATNKHIRQRLLENPEQAVTIEKRYLHKNGSTMVALLSIAAITDKDGNIQHFVAQVVNINNQKQLENSASLFRSMINASREAMFIINLSSGHILDSNIYGCESLGYSYGEMLGLTIFDIDNNITSQYKWEEIVSYIRDKKNIIFDGEYQRKNGEHFHAEVSINHVEINRVEYILAISRDISERKKSEALIWQQANYDMLTELPNRNLLYKKLRATIKQARRQKKKVAVLCLDLDNFKDINDTLGHDIGDQLLIDVGKRLSHDIEHVETVARLGGDEFCIISHYIDGVDHTKAICQSIIKAMSKAFTLDINTLFVSTSIGISLYPDDAKDVDTLLKHSDQAMYFAKANGRNGFQHFTLSMQEKAIERMQLSRDLHSAIDQEQFYIEYQPIVSLANNHVLKAEALLRWKHPERGLISPEEFIPIAEENGTINDIGDWVFEQAIQTAKRWREQYEPLLQISINASPLYFREGNTRIKQWLKHLNTYDLPSNALVIEITEGLFMENSERIAGKFLSLRDAGVQVALDDFGTGYSSLAYLQKLDIDYLKVDKSFIENLRPGSNEEALCEAIIVMAHRLKLHVIAEGIETQEQYQLLKHAGCDYGQGYFFSHPLSARAFENQFFANNHPPQ